MKRIENETIDIIKKIDLSKINPTNDPAIEATVNLLVNIIEKLYSEVVDLRQEIQSCKNEISTLKGEKGKPNIKPPSKNDKDDNINPPQRKSWSKGSKIDKINIDREETIKIDRNSLPSDAQFKGYEEIIIQELIIKTDNVLYKCEKFYSPSEKKTYIAQLPNELKDTEFGPNIKALTAVLYFDYRITENKLKSLFNEFGIYISEGTISNILINEKVDVLTKDKSDIYTAGLNSTSYQQTDDTGLRVAGKNHYVQIMCNPFYSAFFINQKKNRETAQKVVNNGLDTPVFKTIISDDAGQFDKITDKRGLCWVHEFRHYKKLRPIFIKDIEILKAFKSQIKEYYEKLKAYKLNPCEELSQSLSDEFDELFSQITGYDILDERIELTKAKKSQLLLVLEFPEIPLHNNLSENGVREFVVKRKISSGTKNQKGSTAWENYMTISATCKKLKVSFYQYVKGIFMGNTDYTRLATLITQKT